MIRFFPAVIVIISIIHGVSLFCPEMKVLRLLTSLSQYYWEPKKSSIPVIVKYCVSQNISFNVPDQIRYGLDTKK